MDFITQISRTYDGLRDAPREFVLEVEVKAWLNEAQSDLAQRQKVLTKTVQDIVPADGMIVLPVDFVDGRGLRFTDGTEATIWPAEVTDFGTPASGPIARVVGGKIQMHPVPAVGDEYELDYVYDPPDLVANGDVSPLPIELRRKMVDFARANGFLRLNENAQAQYWLDKYEAGLEPPPAGRLRIQPGPMSVGYEPGPFDLVSDAAHRG